MKPNIENRNLKGGLQAGLRFCFFLVYVIITNGCFYSGNDKYEPLGKVHENGIRHNIVTGGPVTAKSPIRRASNPHKIAHQIYRPYITIPGRMSQAVIFSPGAASSVAIDGAHMLVPSHALKVPTKLTITGLLEEDLTPLPEELVNVTQGYQGYRFLPHGTVFDTSVVVAISYDATLLPEGYTKDDVYTWYFDCNDNIWKVLERDSVDVRTSKVYSHSLHFTDMIAGVIREPETSETSGYVPTTFKGMQAVSPASGITQIEPPKANSRGDAEISFPFNLPMGRKGMKPKLELKYNSGAASSWTGYGWDMAIPAIMVDITWGVPRYNDTLESETYLLNGMQLTPLAHRAKYVARKAEKRFYPRIEGDFKKIIRHGNAPNEYWWEVVEKNGNRNYYGGRPGIGVINEAVSRTALGMIGYWALTEVRDVNGNFVSYRYHKPTSCGQKIYPLEIAYTGHDTTEGVYKVKFKLNDTANPFQRKDVKTDARWGYLQRDSFLLKRLDVTFNNEPIRSYGFSYFEGAFCKSLLKNITVFDENADTFYTHRFNYYDDIEYNLGYRPYAAADTFMLPNDNLKDGLVNPLYDSFSEVSSLGLSKSSGFSGGAALTLGFYDGKLQYKDFTAGGNGAFVQSEAEGVLTLTDINADGMLDKVYKKSDGVYFRPNLYDPEKRELFGHEQKIVGLGKISYSKTKGFSSGLEANPPYSFLGFDYNYAKTLTKAYFTDFNGDGMVDFFDGNSVQFSFQNYKMLPEFTGNIDSTVNKIHAQNNIDLTGLPNPLDEQRELEKRFPLHDAVRMWKAPFNGIVAINAPVRLLRAPAASDDSLKDGVRVSIQYGDSLLRFDTIRSNNYNLVSMPVLPFRVAKGNKIYFRVQSIFNGYGDMVEWDPEIIYSEIEGSNTLPSIEDANGKRLGKFKASEDFVLSAQQSNAMPENGKVDIATNFTKYMTSDSIRLEIVHIDSSFRNIALVKSQVFAPGEIVTGIPFNQTDFPVKTGDMFRFRILTSSNIDWIQVNWGIKVEYSYFEDPDKNSKYLHTPDFRFKRVPECDIMFNNILKQPTRPFLIFDSLVFKKLVSGTVDPLRHVVKVVPQFAGPFLRDSIMFSVKTKKGLLAQGKYIFGDSVFNIPATMAKDSVIVLKNKKYPKLQLGLNDTLFFEFDYYNNNITTFPKVRLVFADTMVIPAVIRDTIVDFATYYSPTVPQDRIFGHLYRGWGQFDYSPYAENASAYILQNRLNITIPNTNMPSDTASLRTNGFNPMNSVFNPMVPDTTALQYIGLDKDIRITKNTISSSRFGLQNIYVEPVKVSTTGINGFSKESVDYSYSGSAGFEASAGPLSGKAGISYTRGYNYISQDMMDMNGDGYPDFLEKDRIQYTGVLGTIDYRPPAHNLGYHQSIANAGGPVIGGGFAAVKHSNSMVSPPTAKKIKVKLGDVFKTSNNAQDAEETAKTVFGITPNYTYCSDYCSETWIDMNGDGLPDKVNEKKEVWLNLGYSFVKDERWNFGAIREGVTNDLGIGVGINYRNGSIVGGANVSWSFYNASKALMDVNGDGLPDYVDGRKVFFNTGAGFSTVAVEWDPCLLDFDKGQSFGQAWSGGFTVGIVIVPVFIPPIKVCVNPSGSKSSGLCKSTNQLIDIDGDGMPDYVKSDKESEIVIRSSKLGRTNMLKSVRLPLGGEFTVDYGQTASTCDHPGGQWALKTVSFFDGFEGDGVDTTYTSFEFKNGYYNRRERQFFGFDTVMTYNYSADGKICKIVEQVFGNRFFYTKGLLLSQTIFDGKGRKQKGVENSYALRALSNGGNRFDYETQPICVSLSETKNLSYGGLSSPQILTLSTFSYDTLGNIVRYAHYPKGKDNDSLTVNVSFHPPDSLYVCSVPALHEVFLPEGLMRRGTTEIDNKWNVISINRLIGDSIAKYNFDYDDFGNVSSAIQPNNHKGERMFFVYTYDSITHSLITRVDDAFMQSSATRYNYKWQLPLSVTDMNGEITLNAYDACGRVQTVTDPNELAAGKAFSLRFDYNTDTIVPYARTLHYDSAHNFIATYLFTDGTGRQVQLKKTAMLYGGEGKDDIQGFVVSGKVNYDALGRAVEVFQPLFENGFAGTTYCKKTDPVAPAKIYYDVLNRPTKLILPDKSATSFAYGIGNYKGEKMYIDTITDANGNISVKFTNANGNVEATEVKTQKGDIVTSYHYNLIDELLGVTDAIGNKTIYQYDKLGRPKSVTSPESGLTELWYDNAGNVIKKVTANIRAIMPDTGAVKYKYHYNRLVEVIYPKNIQNRINFTYGKPGDKFGRIGRIKLVEDASGGQEFFYGRQGEVVRTIRTVQLSESDMRTWIWSAKYDTWNRITTMVYPDGETLTYHYNQGGNLQRMTAEKLGRNYEYLSHVGYDEQERLAILNFGNNTSTHYSYEPERQRVSKIQGLAKNNRFMANEYNYDALNNILRIVSKPDSENEFGGNLSHVYLYDEINRLTQASGSFSGLTDTCKYSLTMDYDPVGNILGKTQSMTKNSNDQSEGTFAAKYTYSKDRPSIFVSVGDRFFKHDHNGNQVSWEDTLTKEFRHLAWDEENRLTFLSDNGYVNRYVYDAEGNRVIKSHGGSQGVYINGAPAGVINHSDNNYTIYVSPFFVLRNNRFTKHYYAGDLRVLSKVGNGQFNNQFRPSVFEITAGNVNYINRQQQLANKRNIYYKELPIPPGPPTLKGINGEPEFTGAPIPDAGTPLSSPPAGWPRKPYFSPAGGPPGAPVKWGDSITNDNVEAGFGYNGTGTIEEELRYFYHTDHIRSTNYITDARGDIKQFVAFAPFGETLFEKSADWTSEYKFNAKEKDSETGLYYYGTRYYDPKLGRWLNPHPFQFKHPEVSPFAFCGNNPVDYIDINSDKPVLANNVMQQQLSFINFNAFTASKLMFLDSSLYEVNIGPAFSGKPGLLGSGDYFIGGNEDNSSSVDVGGNDSEDKSKNTGNKGLVSVDSDNQKVSDSGQKGSTKPTEMQLKHDLSSTQKSQPRKGKIAPVKIKKPSLKVAKKAKVKKEDI